MKRLHKLDEARRLGGRISSMIKILTIATILVLSNISISHGKCFPWEVSRVLRSGEVHEGRVMKSEDIDGAECNLVLQIDGVMIEGTSADHDVCVSPIRKSLVVKTSSYCCDQPPCPEGYKNGIFFAKPDCKNGICIDTNANDLNDEDLESLTKILKEDERPDLKFEIINVKSIIRGNVYLLSARKPHYYGIEIVLSKNGSEWVVLKKVESIY